MNTWEKRKSEDDRQIKTMDNIRKERKPMNNIRKEMETINKIRKERKNNE